MKAGEGERKLKGKFGLLGALAALGLAAEPRYAAAASGIAGSLPIDVTSGQLLGVFTALAVLACLLYLGSQAEPWEFGGRTIGFGFLEQWAERLYTSTVIGLPALLIALCAGQYFVSFVIMEIMHLPAAQRDSYLNMVSVAGIAFAGVLLGIRFREIPDKTKQLPQ